MPEQEEDRQKVSTHEQVETFLYNKSMNIFVLHSDPDHAARMMCDKHVVKMILETNQMLSTVARKNGHNDAPYKSTHARHPCTLWAGETKQNWDWLVRHSRALCNEYTHRYGRVHKSQAVTEWAESLCIKLPSIGQTPFRLAMPDQYKSDDPVLSYRTYYLGEKSRFAKWKTGLIPSWWPKNICPGSSAG